MKDNNKSQINKPPTQVLPQMDGINAVILIGS